MRHFKTAMLKGLSTLSDSAVEASLSASWQSLLWSCNILHFHARCVGVRLQVPMLQPRAFKQLSFSPIDISYHAIAAIGQSCVLCNAPGPLRHEETLRGLGRWIPSEIILFQGLQLQEYLLAVGVFWLHVWGEMSTEGWLVLGCGEAREA